jgi:flagellin
LTIGGTAIAVPAAAAPVAGRSANSAIQLAAAINLQSATTGVKATAKETTATISGTDIGNATSATGGEITLTINSQEILKHTASATLDGKGLAAEINKQSGTTGVTASFDGTDVILTAADGRNIEVTEKLRHANDKGYFGKTGEADKTYNGFFKGEIELESSSATALKDGITVVDNNTTGTGILANEATVLSDKATLKLTGIDIAKVTSVLDAEDAIKKIDAAVSNIDTFRGDLGAIQARFESAVASLSTSAENLSAARSRIMDADFAHETANMTKAQILQQAGIAMVSQANSIPNGVLSLLQG